MDTAAPVRRTRTVLVALAAVGVIVAYAMIAAATAASAGAPGGSATVTTSDFVTPLGGGGSRTNWSIKLPAQAKCSGDTANQGFNVNSYIVPSTVDPAALTYDANGPVGAGNFPLIDSSGTPYVAQTTAPNTGQIYPTGPPLFNYAIFSGTQLPPGTYNVGIACANKTGATDVFFNVVETFVAAANDPGGFTWTAANPAGPGGTTTTTSSSVPGGTTTTTSSSVPGGTTTTSSSSVPGGTTTTSTTRGSTTRGTTTTTAPLAASGARSTGSGRLAVTGSRIRATVVWGLVLLCAGGFALSLSRWRQRESDRP